MKLGLRDGQILQAWRITIDAGRVPPIFLLVQDNVVVEVVPEALQVLEARGWRGCRGIRDWHHHSTTPATEFIQERGYDLGRVNDLSDLIKLVHNVIGCDAAPIHSSNDIADAVTRV